MHPSLELSNFLRLPEALRLRAVGAASGAWKDIEYLFIKHHGFTKRSLRLMIPVVYANIDPAGINTLRHQLESSDIPAVTERIQRTLLAFRILITLVVDDLVPKAAFVDLWLRLWSWTEFLDAHFEHLPLSPADISLQYTVYLDLYRLLLLDADADMGASIRETPGFFVMLGRAWSHLLRMEHTCGLHAFSIMLALTEVGSDRTDAAYLRELTLGAGGSWTDLASHVVSHIRQAYPDPNSPATPAGILSFTGIIYLISDALISYLDFRESLLEHGLVTALTFTCRALRNSTPSEEYDPNDTLEIIFGVFWRCFGQPGSQKWIVQALRSGLLLTLFSNPFPTDSEELTKWRLRILEDLPASTVYFSVLSQLRVSLDPANRAARLEGSYLKSWLRFVELVKKRLQVVEVYKTGALTLLRACDNLQCGKIYNKHRLGRCAQCLTSFYCSRLCQKSDWKNGHQASCVQLRQGQVHFMNTFTEYIACVSEAKDRSFLCALLHYDYMQLQESIALSNLQCMHLHPSEPTRTLFDYTQGECKLSVAPCFEPKNEDFYSEEIRRARHSGGRMQLHLMVIRHTHKDNQRRMLPLRSASPEWYEGLRQIVETIPPPTDGIPVELKRYRAEVQRLISLAVVQTHGDQ